MAKHRFIVFLLAVVTALLVCACGDTTESSSIPEGLQTFGVAVDPSAQPSTGQVVNGEAAPTSSSQPAASSGPMVEGDSPTSTEPSASPSSTATSRPTSSRAPSTSSTPNTPDSSPSASPAISPPAPASTATIDEAMAYVGQSLSSLIADLGVPSRSDYEDVDENDPDAGRIGTLYFDGFTVTTLRDENGEVITAVTPN